MVRVGGRIRWHRGPGLGALASALAAAWCAAAGEAPPAEAELRPEAGAGAPEEIVVTATRTPRSLSDAPLSTSVVGRDALDRHGGADIAAALDELEGVEVLRYGGPGSTATVHLRGTYGVHTLVLEDGRTLNSSSLGSADISEVSPALVERVEVVRGGASQLYGAGAVGGVVQVFTREAPAERMRDCDLELGSFGAFGAAYLAGGPLGARGDLFGLLGVSAFTTDGHRPNSYLDSVELLGKLRLGGDASPRTTFTIGARAAELGLPGPVPAPGVTPPYGNDEVTSLVDRAEAASGYLQVAHERGGLRVRASFSSRLDDTHQEWQDFSDHHIVQETAVGASRPECEASYMWTSERLRLLAGASFAHDSVRVETDEKDLDAGTSASSSRHDWRTSGALWGQLELSGGGWDLVAGVRWDEPSDYDGRASARLTGAWGRGAFRLEAGASSAFRAPSLNDLNWPAGPYASGNPDLEPEDAAEGELALEWRGGGRARAKLSAFTRRVDGLIQWNPDASGVWRPENLGRADIAGLELSAASELAPGLRAKVAYTYLDATDTSTRLSHVSYSSFPPVYSFQEIERELAYAPDHQLALSLEWSRRLPIRGVAGTFTFALSASWVEGMRQYYEQWVETVPFTEYDVVYPDKELDAAWVVGLRLAWTAEASKSEVFLRVDNLLDAKYARQFGYSLEDGDYPMPGRSITLGVLGRF